MDVAKCPRIVVVVVVAISVGGANPVLAAPLPLTYQGHLEKEGVPVNGTADFRCSLWTASSGGTRVMDFDPVPGASVVNGLFTIQLQFQVEPPSVLDGNPRWLQIEVASPSGGTYVELSPRQLLTPAPYAHYALAGPGASGFSLPYSATFTNTAYEGSPAFRVIDQVNESAALHGESTGSDGIGVRANVTGDYGIGLYANASGLDGVGVYGTTSGSALTAIYGRANATPPQGEHNTGGHFVALQSGGVGVLGEAQWGVHGKSTVSGGRGVFGEAIPATGNATAVSGESSSGTGVFGSTSATTGTHYGVAGECWSPGGFAVHGRNNAGSGDAHGVYGESRAPAGIGVHGYVDNSAGNSLAKGVYGEVLSTGGYAVYGKASATTGSTYGVYGTTSSPNGVGVYGANSVGGKGIYGYSGSATGWGGYFQGRVYVSDKVGLGTTTPDARLDVAGGNWDPATTEGDVKIGSDTYRLKIGVATSGGGAGDARIYAQGGTNRIILGADQSDVLAVDDANGGQVGIGTVSPDAKLSVVDDAGTAIKATNTGTSIGTSAISAYINNAASSSDTYAGYFDAGGSNGYALYAVSDGNSTVRADCDSTTGHAFYGLSDGNGGGYFAATKAGAYGAKGKSTNGPGVYAEGSGTGTTRSALYVANTNAAGIGVFSTNTSTDANTVIVNKGAGDLVKGFSGATGGDLVFRVANDGTTTVSVLTITGGSDLAEKFDIAGEAGPGMVVEIDPDNPGKLRLARGAYNRRVAGVISGANSVEAGMILADLPGAANSMPVALTGRTWVYCEARDKAVEPGDMLTTADRIGYAMPVVDHDRANGAVIGKAMTRLEKGESGMVLALINLQ